MQLLRQREAYDVCVVGSGAGGGMAAMVLTQAGARVALLEAGPMWDTAKDGRMFAWPYDSPRRGGPTPDRPYGEFDAAIGGWQIEGEPYTVAPQSSFRWFRARMLGGRTNHWGRLSLRFGPDDFRRRSLDGLGDDWPIGYDDLKPYYDRLDTLVGVFGTAEGLLNEPDGIFQPPPKPRCYELLVKRGCDRLGIRCIASRLSILTRPLNGRAACHYCGQCNRGCATNSNFSTPSVLLPPALATGRLRIFPNAMARHVTTDERGLATGVTYVRTQDGRPGHIRARIVVLAASACETARLLLNSRTSRFLRGLGNSSGAVGRFLTDTTKPPNIHGYVPKLAANVPHNEDGVGGAHIYMPWWLEGRKLDFPRAYHIELSSGSGRQMPGYGFMADIDQYGKAGYGRSLKDAYRKHYGAVITFLPRGEMIPNENSWCELDPSTVDRFGIPVLRFHFRHSAHELNQVRHMVDTCHDIIDAMGGAPIHTLPGDEKYAPQVGGSTNHEVGTTRMGIDPQSSVVDRYCRLHDVKNIFIADGGPFVSNPEKNVTWTILALALRTAEHIVDERRRGNLP
jgi:choline dehydrogenase-like flavoprotein